MKSLFKAIAALSFLAVSIPALAVEPSDRTTDEILGQVVPHDASAMNVSSSTGTPVAAEPLAWTTLIVATGSVTSASSKIALPVRSTRVVSLFTNECSTAAVRVGPSTVSATVGQIVKAGATLSLDVPRFFRGALYVIGTDPMSCPYSTSEGLP